MLPSFYGIVTLTHSLRIAFKENKINLVVVTFFIQNIHYFFRKKKKKKKKKTRVNANTSLLINGGF
jgi:hypothetical protein